MNTSKLKFTIVLVVLFGLNIQSQINIIPRPLEIVLKDAFLVLNDKTTIISNNQTKEEAKLLCSFLKNGFNKKPKIRKKGNGIQLVINLNLEKELGKEGYRLMAKNNSILIEGATKAGLFYGIQSFKQILPVDFSNNNYQNKSIDFPVVSISDTPRFQWRSFMLDESRHFKGMEAVKNLLDEMSRLKMNVFHWHLTDDQGWRIEIKKYPKLTEIGSYRKDTQASRKSPDRVGFSHSGFYTQKQIKEIIKYAQERHIKIIPEIEMPGHATAAIASYPWLGILGTTTEVTQEFGKLPDSFNIADPKVTQFLTDVLTEVFELFPTDIVHIGGDEVNFKTWENSKMIQDQIKKEGLTSPADLQIFFTNQMSIFMDKNKHRMMGWNEILGDNLHKEHQNSNMEVKQKLAENAIIHFWKGSLELVKKAVTNGHDVVNSLHSMTYLDYNYKSIPLSKAYSFDPIPEGLDEKYHDKILGSGCQMWSEWIPTVEKMNAQVFPRLAAYAEVGWTKKSNKNYEKFIIALEEMQKRWDIIGINYHKGFD
ncbi:beta-N-acetylhexosaminidase [uncultured Polaribacter sp.]|uniref:beta-N-acetylhexosaminidase n=1 Tax=uncultured Polaribacter sp. TaxID=174711 RepID=UPI00260423F3|nr:beta-N-acetylhexosaminidase [uncultured Polaribacter sp.]